MVKLVGKGKGKKKKVTVAEGANRKVSPNVSLKGRKTNELTTCLIEKASPKTMLVSDNMRDVRRSQRIMDKAAVT